jgi:hypothetical protein
VTVRNLTLVAAATLVIGVVGGVLLFAVPRAPAIPELSSDVTASGADPGRLAWTSWQGDVPCLIVLDATGSTDRSCAAELDGEVVGWEDGEVVLSAVGSGSGTVRVDPTSGATRRGPEDLDATGRPLPGSDLAVARDQGVLTVEVEGTVVWEVDAPAEYTVSWAQVDREGRLVLLRDRAGRWLVVPADGSDGPRLWTEEPGAWRSIAWDRA